MSGYLEADECLQGGHKVLWEWHLLGPYSGRWHQPLCTGTQEDITRSHVSLSPFPWTLICLLAFPIHDLDQRLLLTPPSLSLNEFLSNLLLEHRGSQDSCHLTQGKLSIDSLALCNDSSCMSFLPCATTCPANVTQVHVHTCFFHISAAHSGS